MKDQANGSSLGNTLRTALLVGAGVAIIAAIAFVATLLFMPSKQEYKQVADAQTNLQASYGEYLRLGSQRDFLEISARVSSFQDIVSGGGVSSYASPRLMVNESRLDEIEQNERKVAKKIAKNEQYMDELVANLSDQEVVRLYDDYKTQRQDMYGESSSFEDFAESVIEVYRLLYRCQVFTETGLLSGMDEVRAALSYAKGCEGLTQQLIDGNTLVRRHKGPLADFQQVIKERVDLLETMVSGSTTDFSDYEKMHDSQEPKLLGGILDRKKLIPIDELYSGLEDNLGGVVVRKQGRALGRVEDF